METILVIILLIITIYFIRSVLSPSPKTSNPLLASSSSSSKTSPILEGKFTPQSLYKFNGVDDEKIYILVKGTVYDVTRARQFYGPSGPYSNFAGHDASRGLALNSFDHDIITPFDKPIDTLQGLSLTEWESLNGWEEHFRNKYTKVGVLVEPEQL